jgi:hypothetical protein
MLERVKSCLCGPTSTLRTSVTQIWTVQDPYYIPGIGMPLIICTSTKQSPVFILTELLCVLASIIRTM